MRKRRTDGVPREPRLMREERLRWLDTEISAGRFPNAARMIAELGISRRTVYLDFDFLRDILHRPVDYDHTQRGWYYTEPTDSLPLLHLTHAETAALRRALTVARAGLARDEAATLGLLVERMAPYLPAVMPTGRETASGMPRLSSTASVAPDLLEECVVAVHRRHRMHLLYHGLHRDKETDRVVQPLHLHQDRGEWYLIAHCELRTDLRTFHLSRVKHHMLLEPEAAFTRPADFDGDALIAQGFHLRHGGTERVTVRVRFTPYQARWIREREYHPSQTVEALPEGGLLLSLSVAGTSEVKRWILSFGPEAEVLEPASLRAEIADDLTSLQKIYEEK